MSITFIIGNGFDINCGMKCTYRDVYQEYKKEPSPSAVIEKFKKEIDPNSKTWADFEVAMAQHLPNFSTEREFLLCLRDFKKYLNFHLNKEDKRILKLISNDYVLDAARKEMARSFNGFYKGISPNVDRKIETIFRRRSSFCRAITFNYTSTFDKLYDLIPEMKEKSVLHIHGSLNNNDIVLGMDNIKQLPNVSFEFSAKAERAFIKPTFNRQFDEARLEQAIMWIEDSTIICVYGLSLGESDLTWRDMLVQWLLKDDDHHLFLYDYEYSSLPQLTADEKLDHEEDAKQKLLASWNLFATEYKKVINQIHIPCAYNIFNMGLTIQNALEEYTQREKARANLRARLENAAANA